MYKFNKIIKFEVETSSLVDDFVKGLNCRMECEPGKMKTAVTVLQEMMVKLGQTPEYECTSQSGPQHSATFEYQCRARGATVKGTARSKKEAKQEAARLMLLELSARGEPVPPPYSVSQKILTPPINTSAGSAGPSKSGAGAKSATPSSHSYVALLKDLCDEYRLPGVEYDLVSDTGPPHMRHFTIRARLGQHVRLATSTTKKTARQQAAEQLYKYLRENLSRLTKDFVEEEALVRVYERAMERYVEIREEVPWRPHLGQVVADYHLGLVSHLDPDKVECGRIALECSTKATKSDNADEEILETVVAALGLTLTRTFPDSESNTLCLLDITPTSPPLTFAGLGRNAAAANALLYLRMALA